MRSTLAAAALLLALVAAEPAASARFAVGLEAGASPAHLAERIAGVSGGRVSRDLLPLGALLLEAPSARGVARLPGVAYVERTDARRRLAFTPTDPLAARQWYIEQTRAFEAWPELPTLLPVRVAVIDSGIDGGHPEFQGRILEARSFVGGDPRTDQHGHGTFVAGIIAANLDNGQGIAGLAPSAELLVAKVVRRDRSVSVEAEARAIRWAVDRGARVINLSLGGLRDPLHADRDTYSPLEASAVAYAQRRGAVLIAAVGNANTAPKQPWPFASYPAALPHVLGVSALARDGSVPLFSHRDAILNDLAAPGTEILSTLPRALAPARGACTVAGYSDCGPDEYRQGEGTSFAAPQVTAAAALLLALRPELAPEQVTALLTRTAADVSASSGCPACPPSRDALTGWGRLDVASAIAAATADELPPRDAYETNDDAGLLARRLYGRSRTVEASIDFWDDQSDVYRVLLRAGERFSAALRGPAGTRLFLWRPGTERVDVLSLSVIDRVASSARRGVVQRFSYRVRGRRGGWYFLQVKAQSPGAGGYSLGFEKTR
ncbi:MAG: S8 family serine peptidase [Actinobacteria bacterium]|nr:S8 family serine peptidase [Actinomycetota bacterium]